MWHFHQILGVFRSSSKLSVSVRTPFSIKVEFPTPKTTYLLRHCTEFLAFSSQDRPNSLETTSALPSSPQTLLILTGVPSHSSSRPTKNLVSFSGPLLLQACNSTQFLCTFLTGGSVQLPSVNPIEAGNPTCPPARGFPGVEKSPLPLITAEFPSEILEVLPCHPQETLSYFLP